MRRLPAASVADMTAAAPVVPAAAAAVADVAAATAAAVAPATAVAAAVGHPPQGQELLRLLPQRLVDLPGTLGPSVTVAMAGVRAARARALHLLAVLALLLPPGAQRLGMVQQAPLQLPLLLCLLGLQGGIAANALADAARAAAAICVLGLAQPSWPALRRHLRSSCGCGAAQLRAHPVGAARSDHGKERQAAELRVRSEHNGPKERKEQSLMTAGC